MGEPLTAAAWGLLAASSLVIGAALGLTLGISRRVVALIMGFGAGALVSALAFDLTEEAFETGGTLATAVGLAAGAVAYYLGDALLERRTRRRQPEGERTSTGGPAIVLGALLDGIPESVVLGATVIGASGVSPSLLAAIFVSNLPEALAGARDLRDEGRSRRFVLGVWTVVAAASAVAAGLGSALLGGMDAAAVGVVQAFAGGAILAMLATTMIPEAYENGGDTVALATVLGFATAFLLSRA
jgi:zinc transporter, ZIP family